MHLSLETTQFRYAYGVRPTPLESQPQNILACAYRHGIRAFDTAGAYDEAEKILGNFISRNPDSYDITTKIRPNALYSITPMQYYGSLKQNLLSSLRNLGMEQVRVCLFHNADHLENEAALAALYRLKEEGLAEKVGVCISDPDQFEAADMSPYIEVIQIPYNVFDTRLDALLAQTNKEIQARNIFLQGLILMDEASVLKNLSDVKPYLHTLGSYCERLGVTRAELAMTFVKTQKKISQVIIGVDNVEQLDEDCTYFSREGDYASLRELPDQLGGLDERIIQPSLWHGEFK